MDSKQNFLSLLGALVITNSPAVRLNAVYEFLRLEPDYFTRDEQDTLIASYQSAKEAKSKAGLTDAQKRWQKKQETKQSGWLFISESPYGKVCQTCFSRYEIGDPVFVEKPSMKGFHPECVSATVRDTNTYYKNFTKTKIENQ